MQLGNGKVSKPIDFQGHRSRSNFNLDYISAIATLLPLYNPYQAWFAVKKWKGLEAF